MAYNWNEEQQAIIDSRGHDILVSASAGSGKTTVMLERVRQLIISDRVPIKRIVMLSFNESIASELKSKLYAMLENELLTGSNGYALNAFIEEQLDNIGKADISTMDAFANRLIREYFDRLGLDPSATVGDEKENKNRLKKSVKAVIKNAKESGDNELYELRNKLGGDKNLIDAVLKAYTYATVQADSEGWLNAVQNIYLKKIDLTGLVIEYTTRFGSWYSSVADKLEEFLRLSGAESDKAVVPYLVIDLIRRIAKEKKYSDIYMLTRTDIPKQSYTKAIFGEYKAEISALTKTLIEAVNNTAGIFNVSPQEAEKLHSSVGTDAKKIGELALKTMAEYRRAKDSASVIDFSDMTYYAAKLLKNDDIADEIRARYDYVFVDEYQDQNYVAEYILSRISKDNLFTVGDVKQSIYGFRLAEPAIMISRTENFSADDRNNNRNITELKAVRLNQNYRSDAQILNAVNSVFDIAMTKILCGVEYRDTERFVPHAEYGDNGVEKFKCVFFVKGDTANSEEIEEDDGEKCDEMTETELFNPNKREKKAKRVSIEDAEGEYIADKIAELLKTGIYDKDIGAIRPLKFSDICILSRDRMAEDSELESVINVLLSHGYPVDCSGVRKNKEVKEVELIIDMLRVIDNSANDIPLATALLSVWGGFTSAELYEIRRANPSLPFNEAVKALLGENDKITRFFALIDSCRAELSRKKLADVIAMLVYDYGYENELVRDRVSLQRVQQFISSLEGYGGTLSEYLATADSGIEYESVADSVESHYIQTNTIHRSKGLEYPIVFLVGAGKTFNLRNESIVTFKGGIGINAFDSATLTKQNAFACDMLNLIKREDERNEEMRLLYVAMTRAMNHLFITGVVPKKKSAIDLATLPNTVNCYKDWISNAVSARSLPSNYIEVQAIEPRESIHVKNIDLPLDITDAKPVIDEYIYKPYPYEKATRLGLKHTVTELVSPYRYEDKFVYKTADVGEDELAVNKAVRGTDYHKILEHIDYHATTLSAVTAELDRMVSFGILEREQLDLVDRAEILQIMNSDIIALARVTPHRREQEFTLAVKANEYFDCDTDDEIIVQGAIDLIIMGEELIIVDFKKSKKSADELKKAYSLQLKLYARAASEALGRQVDKMLLYSISTGEIIEI